MTDALTQAETRLDGVVILGAEIAWSGRTPQTIRATVDWEALRNSTKPVAIALRVAPFPELKLPFSVALPTYRCLAGYDSAGKLLGIAMDSVNPAWPPSTHVLEFATDAADLARLVKEWQAAHPPELLELLWYRVTVAPMPGIGDGPLSPQ